ncbi:transcription factor Tfb2 [Clavulina sp. PMI_390]|nr:transcription factor Tfb2 [Clavulina sp. PMI_390]
MASSSSSSAPKAKREHVLLPFLKQQSEASLSNLYKSPSSCLSVYRLLHALERQIVISLVWLDNPTSRDSLASWVRQTKEARRLWDRSLDTLSRLRLIVLTDTSMNLNAQFRTHFRIALQGGGNHRSFGVPSSDKVEKEGKDGKRPPVTIEFLDNHTAQKWETILHFLVSSGSGNDTRPSDGVLFLLLRGGLMAPISQMTITSRGFQFLLQPPHEQLWDLLQHSLELCEERGMIVVDVLSLLLMLSTMELGQDYSTELLTATQIALLEDLRDYGLVWQRNSKSRRFYPTRLATTLTSALPSLIPSTHSTSTASTSTSNTASSSALSGALAGGAGHEQGGFIIIETNYRLYAYTDNALQIAVLNLFVSLRTRFPNLVVGALTRESVNNALNNGITADQIISYLTTHAHPHMRKNNPVISSTVQDQIRIWENERNRVKTEDGFLYTEFTSEADFLDTLHYAKQNDAVVWESRKDLMFFVTSTGHEVLRAYIKRKSEQQTMMGTSAASGGLYQY